MEQSLTARLGCVQGQIRTARARLRASHEQAQVELAAAQAELVAVLSQGWRKGPLGQIRARGDQRSADGRAPLPAGGPPQAALKAAWDEVQAAWGEGLTDAQGKAAAWAPARSPQAPATTPPRLSQPPQLLARVARPPARFAQLQAGAAEAPGKSRPREGPEAARPVSAPVLRRVYEQVAAAVGDILLLALRELERARRARRRLPVLSRLSGAVHAQVEGALRGILAKAAQEVAAADRVELAEALCGQVEKAVRDVLVKTERDWGGERGRPGEGSGQGWPGGRRQQEEEGAADTVTWAPLNQYPE